MGIARRALAARILLVLLVAACCPGATVDLYVDPERGSDQASGSQAAPVQTLGAAIRRIPLQTNKEHVIHLAGGVHPQSGAGNGSLELNRQMHEGASVRITSDNGRATLDWQSPGRPMIDVVAGDWSLENVQIGNRRSDQRAGVRVAGPARLKLRDVRIRTASQSGAGLHATRGAMVELSGTIELNEDLHEDAGAGESFARIEADYGGVVRFTSHDGSSLSIGNGSLCASYYGVIELGCAGARITSWHDQANTIAVNNSGRVDFHGTPSVLAARNPRNTPIGLEHDGHVLAEGAPITIVGHGNGHAIVLQKASTLFCNDVRLEGDFRTPLSSMSGSTLLVGIDGDLGGGEVRTGATIILERCSGRLTRPIDVRSEGRLVLPAGMSNPVPEG